jgi:hypothetical protein
VDGLAQLLNQFAQTRCHEYLQSGGRREHVSAGCGVRFIYLTANPVQEQTDCGGEW